MAGTELKYGRGYKIVQSVILGSFPFHCISSYSVLFSLFFFVLEIALFFCALISWSAHLHSTPLRTEMISPIFLRVSLSCEFLRFGRFRPR